MAPFNPEIKPTNDPKYGNDFRPINPEDTIKPRGVETNTILPEGQKIGDKSAEYAGQAAAYGMQAEGQGMAGIGKLFENVASIGNTLAQAGVNVVKKDIEDKVYDAANRTRQEYTDMLERIKTNVGTKNLLDANASADMPDGADTPDEIVGLGSHLAGLASARDAGKISGTYYAGRLLAEAKDLRARYPGFRQEIDEQFARVTGMNPANAYIKSMVQDINRAVSSSASSKLNTEKWIRDKFFGTPVGNKTLQEFKAGLIDENEVYNRLAPYEKESYDLERSHKLFQANKDNKELNQTNAKDTLDKYLGIKVRTAADALTTSMGLSTTEDIARLETLNRNAGIPSQQWQKWGQQIENAILDIRLRAPQDADRFGYTQAVGGKANVNSATDEAIKQLTALRDRVYAHDTGGIYDAARNVTAMRDDDTKRLLEDSEVGPPHRLAQVFRNIGGEQWSNTFTLDLITKGNMPAKINTYYTNWAKEITSQSGEDDRGRPVTFNSMADEFKKKGVVDKNLNNKLLSLVDLIDDPNTPDAVKINIAKAAFSQGNRGMIARLNMDGYDSQGRPVQGQNAFFQKFTSPEKTAQMKRLGEKDPQVWQNYIDWAKETLTSDLMSKDINQMKTISSNPESRLVKIGWDPENKRFKVTDERSAEVKQAQDRARGGKGTADNTYYGQVNSMVNRMNNNLYNFKRIAVVTGEDVDQFVLKTIADYAGKEALQNVDGLPAGIINSIIGGKMREKFKSGGQH